MVGLRNRSTWEPLLLKASCIKSCANGCSMGITAHLTYANAYTESVEGVFVYPLEEKEVVVGFEAMIAGRLVGVHIQNRGKLKDCCLECCPGSVLDGLCGSGQEWSCCCEMSGLDIQCTNGHLILDEDMERTTFIVGCGVIGPMDIVSVIISTTLELPTMENGAIRIVYPKLLTPVVTGQMTTSKIENGGKSEETGCFGATSGKQDRPLNPEQQCSHGLFTSPAVNLAPYELNFQLLVRGACLLAGLESPTHALRADADPSAQSASATYITLAQEHPYDRHIEIILHLSGERYHKDILCNPVLMLNFCPDLLSEPLELHKATRELLFLIDRSGSMSGTNIHRVKVTLMQAYEYIQRMRADMRGTNLQGALSWLYQQPMQRSYPRQVFIITDGSISNVAKVLELVRRNTCAGRHWLGSYGVRRHILVQWPEPTEEHIVTSFSTLLQLIRSLKKAFEPVLTDVRIDWYLPENMEALLSPNEIPPLYPGDRLNGRLDGGQESRRRQKVLARSTMAARSFSSPQGELEMHRLRRALERVSFDQTLGGRLDESDGETRPPSRGAVSHRSLTDSSICPLSPLDPPDGLLFPASPLEWDSLTDPEYLFTASQPEDPPRGQCRSIIHGLLSGKPVSWEVTVDVGHLWPTEDQDITGVNECGIGGEDVGKPWEEIIHHLTARSVIRDFEKLAEKECDTGHGIAR
ncbi:hypothetical protein GOODEAATRI_008260 [Goodea atripinnis]|uniref:VWFA domain-containing protein n=1 Tax=Goodea atripinnis TaxID=208336 RepID=A0ABV0PX40_9TELE